MRTFGRLAFHHWSTSVSVTDRTAVYGPVRTVVWQGSAGDRRPYAECAEHVRQLEGESPFHNLMEVK
jgi:hypothetical protein